MQRGEDLTDLTGIGNAVVVLSQVKFACHLGHAEFNAVFTAGEQIFKGLGPLEFDEIICILLYVLPIHQAAWQLQHPDIELRIL